MIYKALIVEDEIKNAELLNSMVCSLYDDIEIVGVAKNVKEATEIIHIEKPKIVFLDINLGSESGFEILNKTNSSEFEVIVITAYSDYSLQAIKNSAIDYILKPFDFDELRKAIDKAKSQIKLKLNSKKENYLELNKLSIPTLGGVIFIEIEDIIYIKANSSYSEFNTIDQLKIIASKRLSNYEDALICHKFLRVHKSYIVNLKHIKQYNKGRGGSLIMLNGSLIPVAEDKKKELMSALSFQ